MKCKAMFSKGKKRIVHESRLSKQQSAWKMVCVKWMYIKIQNQLNSNKHTCSRTRSRTANGIKDELSLGLSLFMQLNCLYWNRYAALYVYCSCFCCCCYHTFIHWYRILRALVYFDLHFLFSLLQKRKFRINDWLIFNCHGCESMPQYLNYFIFDCVVATNKIIFNVLDSYIEKMELISIKKMTRVRMHTETYCVNAASSMQNSYVWKRDVCVFGMIKIFVEKKCVRLV